jgi:hypothetical protein
MPLISLPTAAKLFDREPRWAERRAARGYWGPVRRRGGRAHWVEARRVEEAEGVTFTPAQLAAAGVQLEEAT